MANTSEWATKFFAAPLTPDSEGAWHAQVPMLGGPARYRQEIDLAHGAIDLYLAPDGASFGPPPVRVVPNGEGADVLFTLSRFPGSLWRVAVQQPRESRHSPSGVSGGCAGRLLSNR